MKVVCIDNSTKPDLPLTIGKIYDVLLLSIDENPSSPVSIHYSICCDDGINRNFHKSRFITLEEWRERKLNELGI